MSCPYFDPREPSNSPFEPRLSMLPLGDSWTGTCTADPLQPIQPADPDLRTACNLGYARQCCRRFPAEHGPDAARFAIARDDGSNIRVSWVLELDHHPFAHGALDYSRGTREFTAGYQAPPIIVRQARAYVDSYLRRTARA